MVERKAPILFSFDAPGAFIEGILFRIDRVNIKGKDVTQYTFDCADGEVRKILGTYDIDTKLRPTDRGKFVQVAFARVSTTVGKNGNMMHEFQVLVDEGSRAAAPQAPAVNAHGVEITDADIGF